MGDTWKNSTGCLYQAEEIRRFADLTAAMLGHNLEKLEGEERLKVCHALLEQHPYAYPFALELSLRLPSAMAITWLRKLRETFYALDDVQDEIDPFQIWRMQPVQALTTALRHAERANFFLPGVMGYLLEHRPVLASCLQSKQKQNQGRSSFFYQGMIQLLYRLCASPILPLKEFLLRFYMRHDTKDRPGSRLHRICTWLLAYLLANRKSGIVPKIVQFASMPLPNMEESSTSPQAVGQLIEVVTVIWGEKYVQRWAELNAPSLLASGNIPTLAQDMSVCLVFYTTSQDKDRIRALPVYQRLRQYASVRFMLMDRMLHESAHDLLGLRFADKYVPMSAAHNHCIRLASKNKNFLFFNFPDIVWQNNFFEKIIQLIQKGKTNIYYYSGPYLELESARKHFLGLIKDGVLSVDNQEMRDICARYRHPSALLEYRRATLRYFGAIMRMYSTGRKTGDIIHMSCYVPLVIRAEHTFYTRSTIDADHLIYPLLNADSIEIISDNISLCVASLDSLESQDNAMRWPPYNMERFSKDFRLGMRLWNKIFFSRSFRFYAEDTGNNLDWRETEEFAEHDIKEVLQFRHEDIPVPPLELFLLGAREYLKKTTRKSL